MPELHKELFDKRLNWEAKLIRDIDPSFQPVSEDLTIWEGYILGKGLYKGGVFKIQINIPNDFPFKAPIIKFLTPIWHPTISFNGDISARYISDSWKPNLSIVDLIQILIDHINYPNPSDPMKFEAADQLEINIGECT